MSKSKPRELYFNSFDELIADVERLRKHPPIQTAKWNLAMNLQHLALSMTISLHGPGKRIPSLFQPLVRFFIRRTVRKNQYTSIPLIAPKDLRPSPTVAEADAYTQLRDAVDELRVLTGPTVETHVFGRLTIHDFQQMMLIHAAHHLSHLLPTSP